MEEYNPEKIKEHREVKKPFYDKLDGRYYVKDTIEWHVIKVKAPTTITFVLVFQLLIRDCLLIIEQGQSVPTQAEYPLSSVYRIFDENAEDYRCEENLWVSDGDVASHYKLRHKMNKGISDPPFTVSSCAYCVFRGRKGGDNCCRHGTSCEGWQDTTHNS